MKQPKKKTVVRKVKKGNDSTKTAVYRFKGNDTLAAGGRKYKKKYQSKKSKASKQAAVNKWATRMLKAQDIPVGKKKKK